MRQYEKVVKEGIDRKGRPYQVKIMHKGLKKVHIGEDVWLFGRQTTVNGKAHMVIYGPNRKEYHVWGSDVKWLITEYDSDRWDNWGYGNRQGNRAIQAKVKIYILTSILDAKENWSFDLNKVPVEGPLKVIYQNGTVKNIEFDGEFKAVELTKKYGYKNKVQPIGYRYDS